MSQAVNWNVVASYARGIWAVVGPLLGVLIGAYIANRNQRRHWIADNKKEEYRELLAAMSKGFGDFLRLHNSNNLVNTETNKVQLKVLDTIHDRIFTSDEVLRLDIFDKWAKATSELRRTGDGNKFAETIGVLLQDIRDAALKDIIS